MGHGWKVSSATCGLSAPLWPGRGMDPPSACPGRDKWEQLLGGWRDRAWGLMGQSLLHPSCCPKPGKKESERASFTSSAASSSFKWTTGGDSGPPGISPCQLASPSQSSVSGL